MGVTGSIAAYKAAILVRLLVKEGAEVQVVMTPSGKEFIKEIDEERGMFITPIPGFFD